MARLRVSIPLILMFGIVLSLSIATPQPALAADIVVADNTAYPCTQAGLASAVAAAVTNDPDNPGLVTFNCADPIIEFNANPVAPILIGDFSDTTDFIQAVIIDGSNNGAPITLDGVADDGVDTNFFNVNSDIDPENPTPQSLLTIQHMTLKNGSLGFGGAILNEDSTLNVADVTFIDNHAEASGGAIFNSLGDLTVSQSTFSNNQAPLAGGGAIFSRWGTVSVSDSTFTNNLGAGFGGGGAIATEDAKATISNSTFSLNQGGNGGGAIISSADELVVSGSTFSNNQAGGGGAIFASNLITISNSSFINNHTTSGIAQTPSPIPIPLGPGGAVFAAGTVSITQTSFTGNTSASAGGAIASGFANMTISQVSFDNNQALLGGAIYFAQGNLDVGQSAFTNNKSTTFIGGAIVNTAIATFSQSSFIDNSAVVAGGAIYSAIDAEEDQTQVIASTFSGNTADTAGSSIALTYGVDISEVPDPLPTLPTYSNIAWSTINQPVGTSPALYIGSQLNITGLILAGATEDHCEFARGGVFADEYSLANDDSCGLTGAGSIPNIDPLLGALTPYIIATPTSTFGGVNGAYFPLATDSPAIDGGPPTGGCDTGLLPDTDPESDQRGTPRPTTFVCDIGAIETADFRPTLQSIDAPATTNEGVATTITINAQDPNTTNLLYTIDCDNDSTPEIENSPSNQLNCTYPDNGDYTGQITISDGENTYSDSFDITVNNLAPVMSTLAASPTLVAINTPVVIQMSATDVIADTLTFTIDCGNTVTTTAANITSTTGTFNGDSACHYTEPGHYTISVTAADEDGGTSTAMTTTVDAISLTTTGTTINEGQSVTLTINEQSNDPLTYTLDCDTSDATGPAATNNPATCNYPDNDSYNSVITVSRGSETVSFPFTVTVNNLAPVMTSVTATPSLVAINTPITVQMAATDVPADTLTFSVNCGIGPSLTTGTITSTSGTFSTTSNCTYTQTGFYTISATATDDDGDTSDSLNATTTVQVVIPVSLCANQWNGALRMADDCSRSETPITLPEDGPTSLCVNNWNGAARASTNCSRSEHQIIATGNDTIPTCINTWNNTLRVSDHCTRSETADWL